MEMKTKITVDLVKALRKKFEKSLPVSLLESQLFVDLADIHEACRVYLGAIDKILSENTSLSDIIKCVCLPFFA
ncbi:MAG: hypothetical protein HY028_11760 [Gammaproteobacteria bacterium]|nr:hypothetical protein [Gammaproteobacteria bacterium]